MSIDQPAAYAPYYRGIFLVVPTAFTEIGELDLASQKRAIDFMIDAGPDGLCILANFSEQLSLPNDGCEVLIRTVLEHVADRVSVVITTSHYSTQVCTQRSRRVQDMGAAMLTMMPPYHGATFRMPESQIYRFLARVPGVTGIPIMIQDIPVSGTVLSAAFLARMARKTGQMAYFKIETPGAAIKLRGLIRLGGDAAEGPWDDGEAITLLADPDAGTTDSIIGDVHPDGIRPIIKAHVRGQHDFAFDLYQRQPSLINRENRQTGILVVKALMKEGNVIACKAPCHPLPPMYLDTCRDLVEIARRLDPLVLRWG